MQLVFNELSLNETANKQTGIQNFHKFLMVYHKAVAAGFERAIQTYNDLNTVPIAENYYSSQWRNTEKDREMIRRYQGLCDRQLICQTDDDWAHEIKVNGKSGKGVLYAYLHDEILISICGKRIFERFSVKAEYCSVDKEEETEVCVLNISKEADITDNLKVWEKRKQSEYMANIGRDEFMAKLPQFYPSLVFGDVALRQLKNEIEHQHFRTVRMKLFELENVFANWSGEKITSDMFRSKMTPESPETLKRFQEEHTFRVEGKEVIANYHIRYTGNIQGRIYFSPNKEDKKCYICSLTTKLPTVTSPKMKI